MSRDDARKWAEAAAMLSSGRTADAQRTLAKAGTHPGLDALRAAAITLARRPDLAAPSWNKLLEKYPEDACLLQGGAINDLALGLPSERAERAWKVSPGDPQIGVLYAMALQTSDPAAAGVLLEEILAAHPGDPVANLFRGQQLLAEGDSRAIGLLKASGFAVDGEVLLPLFKAGQMDEYMRVASRMGLPLGDEGKLAEAEAPMAAFRSLIGYREGEHLVASIVTTRGTLRCELYPEVAPVTVANFVGLSRGTVAWVDPRTGEKTSRPLYTETGFHRVIPDFMIQGGDPAGDGTGGPGYQFLDEIDGRLHFDRPGRLAMANAGPGTNGSQWFVTEAAVMHLDGRHTIFGQCDEASLEVVKAITHGPRDERDRPKEAVNIESIVIAVQ